MFWKFCFSHWGLCHHSSCCANWEGNLPLEAESAGFSVLWIWRQHLTGIASDISATLFPTNDLKRLGFPCSHPNITWLSVQAKILVDGISNVLATWLSISDCTTPLHNSNRRINSYFIGGTFVLARTRDVYTSPSESIARKYTTPEYVSSEALQNLCTWILSTSGRLGK